MTTSILMRVRAREGQQLRVEIAVSRYVSETRAEPGSVAVAAYRSPVQDGYISIIQAFRDDIALEFHQRSPHRLRFEQDMAESAEGGAAEVVPLSPIAPPPRPPAGRMRGVDHFGIRVPDVEAATHFLQEAFGASVVYDAVPRAAAPLQGAEVERRYGLPSGARIVHMRLLRLGRSASFELVQIEGAEARPAAGFADQGLTHIGIYVDDIESTSERFRKAGGHLLTEPAPLPGAEAAERNVFVLGRTPWGMMIELLSYPDGMAYPPEADGIRWTPPLRRF